MSVRESAAWWRREYSTLHDTLAATERRLANLETARTELIDRCDASDLCYGGPGHGRIRTDAIRTILSPTPEGTS